MQQVYSKLPLLFLAIIITSTSLAGCKKKDQTQQMATVKQESETETVKETETNKETEIQNLPQKTTESDSTGQKNTEASTGMQTEANNAVTSQENAETEELEIGGEDSWEDSADGWD